MSVGDRDAGKVVEGRNDVFARIELFAGLGIECVESGVVRLLGPNGGVEVESLVRRGLLCEITAAEREDNAAGNYRGFAVIDIARHPNRHGFDLAVLINNLECGHTALYRGRRVGDGEMELGVSRTPEWRQNPARSLVIFPTRKSAPAPTILEVDLLIAEKIGAEERLLMLRPADGAGIEQRQTALLAGSGNQLLAMKVKDRRRVVGIEIALLQPLPVGWNVIVLECES